jgi:iron complex transport system substrate-binding protein
VVFTDASSNAIAGEPATDPVADLRNSMKMWGVLLGASAKAEAFASFFERELTGITARLAGTTPVTTYLEVQSTLDDCCWAAGRKVWGDLLALAGGQPLPGVTAPWFEKLSLEYLLSTRPTTSTSRPVADGPRVAAPRSDPVSTPPWANRVYSA